MENLTTRFNNTQQGGEQIYQIQFNKNRSEMDAGGKSTKSRKLSPCSENWRKKYLELKVINKNLKKENQILKKKKNLK